PGQLLFTVAAQIALLAMAGTTAWLAVEGTIGIPEAIALIVVVVRFVEPFNSIRDLAPAMETSRSALADIRTVIDTPGPESGGRTAEVAESAAAVELRSVRFGYREDGDGPVLDGLDIEFMAGEVTAIVGPSGAGKSTELSLVAGPAQPNPV